MQRLLVFLLIIYASAVVFAPPIPGNEWLRIDDFILGFAVLISILSRLKSRRSSNSGLVLTLVVIVYLILLLMLLSTLLAGFYSQYEYSGFTKELLRLGKYIFVVFLALSIENKRYRQIVTYWVIVLGVLVVITQIAQFIGGFQFNQMFAQFYGDHRHYGVALSPTARAYGYFYAGGPFGNPNFASSFLIMPFLLSLFYVFRGFVKRLGKKSFNRSNRIVLVFVTFILFVGILLTDSRAAMVTVSIVGIFFLFISRSDKGGAITLIAIVAPLTILLLLAPIITNKGLMFDHIGEGFSTGGSLTIKLALFKNGIHQLDVNKYWWGFGPGKGPSVDFEMGTFVIWYGIPGAIAYFAFWVGSMWGVVRSKKSLEDWQAIFAIIMAMFIVNFSQSTFLNARIFPIFIIIILMNITNELIESSKPVTQLDISTTLAPN